MRAVVIIVAATLALGGCSWFGSDKEDKEAAAAKPSTESSDEILKRDCADPKWKEQNLGLWYSVCRQPMKW